MIDRLDHLVEIGITALELMPLADFAGSRNWGYDGVLWYAPDSAYGRPEDLKALIDAAHQRGLMVMLDVVYNHFGPEGNYLGRYAPAFFTEAHTPWGSAIDYRVKEVRAFAIENALSWLRDYRFDGLRLDAVNSIVEPGGLSLLHDLSAAAGKLAAETGRHIHLVLENGDNRASILDADAGSAAGQISRAVERRLSPRLARADDRREAGLLRRLPARADLGYRARAVVRLHLSGRAVGVFAAASAASRAAIWRRRPSSTSCRTTTRSAIARWATGSKASADARAIEAALAVLLLAPSHSHAVHGRGMGLESALPVLLRFRAATSPTPSARAAAVELAWAYAEYRRRGARTRSIRSTRDPAVLDWNERDTAGGAEAADAGARPA